MLNLDDVEGDDEDESESLDQVVGRYDVEETVEEDVHDDLKVSDAVEDDLGDRAQDDGLTDVEWILRIEGVDEVALRDSHGSGRSLLTPMATHTGVGLVMQDEVVEVDVIQDVENEMDVIENVEDEKLPNFLKRNFGWSILLKMMQMRKREGSTNLQ